MRNATVLLVCPNKLSRASLRKLFDGSPFSVIGEAPDRAHFVQPAGLDGMGRAPADLVLMEISEEAGVLEALRCLDEKDPDTPVVVLVDSVCLETLASCLGAGASGVLTKDITREALLRSLDLVLLGETVFPTDLARLLASGLQGDIPARGSDGGYGLSDREVMVLQCLLRGEANKVIANRLRITEATIKVHLKNVLRKIKATNRTQAAIWAHAHGYQPAGDAEQRIHETAF